MAYFENLARRCATLNCPRPSTMVVFTKHGTTAGEYCNACGQRRILQLEREERAAEQKRRGAEPTPLIRLGTLSRDPVTGAPVLEPNDA